MKFAAAVAFVATLAQAKPAEEKVEYLPMMRTFDEWEMYSGYMTIGDTSKQIHYLFVESQNDPANDPVLLWTNGGPGCSSMLGFLQENGPFNMESGTSSFRESATSWNKEANVLYVEQPAGVGFSYCSGTKDCTFDDESAGQDNLDAILQWFDKFPEFKDNDFYLSGESYGGIYVPYMAHEIVKHNEANADDDSVFKPNLKGFAVGNGVTNWDYDTLPALVEMAYWHSLMPQSLHDQFVENECDFTGPYNQKASDTCLDLLGQFGDITANINIYDMYGICWGAGPYPQNEEPTGFPHLYKTGQSTAPKKVYTASDYTPWLMAPHKKGSKVLKELPPCTYGSGLLDYLNSDEVKTAMHIPDFVQAWDLCTSDINYVIQPKGSQWIYEELAGKIRMLHYSGDIDGSVPTMGTLNWINSLNWDVTEAWRSYHLDGQVAGYVESYEGGLTFGSVHGAGHMAPQFKPYETYHLVMNWLHERDI